MVKDNSQIQAGAAALKSKASQLTDNVSSKLHNSLGNGSPKAKSAGMTDALKSTPIAAVGQQAAEKAQAVQGLITGQTKVVGPLLLTLLSRITKVCFLRSPRQFQTMWKKP